MYLIQDLCLRLQYYYSSSLCILKKDVVWTWSRKAQEAFNTFKEKLSEFPILRKPDFSKVFILHIYWSVLVIGAILGQLDEESKKYFIAYAS